MSNPIEMISLGMSPQLASAVVGSTLTGLTAAGTTTTDALVLTASNSDISTCGAGAGVRLKSGYAGQKASVYNGGANALLIYPPTGGNINGAATNAALSLAVGDTVSFRYATATAIRSVQNSVHSQQAVTSLATVGAGTLTAALIAGGVVTRDGAQSATAFTDTTDTAALIVAAIANAKAGQSLQFTYKNNTDGIATLAAGSGVTLGGVSVIPANSFVRFVVVLTSLSAVAITGIEVGSNIPLQTFKRVAITANTSTLSLGDMEGALECVLNVSGQATPTFTTRTGTELAAAIPGIQVGFKYRLRVVSTNSGNTTMAAAASGVTISGTATIATNAWREYLMSYTAANTWTMTSIGTGTNS